VRFALRAGMVASRLALVERAIPAQTDYLEDEAGWSALNIIVKKPRPDRAEINLKQIQSD
jgi:hypothetical protein